MNRNNQLTRIKSSIQANTVFNALTQQEQQKIHNILKAQQENAPENLENWIALNSKGQFCLIELLKCSHRFAKPEHLFKRVKGFTDLSENFQNTPSLVGIKKYYGENLVLEFLNAWLSDLASNLNVNNNFTNMQLERAAYDILDDYIYSRFRIDDFILFAKMVRTSKFGELYGRFDTSMLFKFLERYRIERSRFFEDKKRRQEAAFKRESFKRGLNYHEYLERMKQKALINGAKPTDNSNE